MDKNGESNKLSNDSNALDPLCEEIARQFVIEGDMTTIRIAFDCGVGYNRACRIVEQLEAAGIVGPNRGRKPREVLVDLPTLDAMLKKN